jgi:predicted O-linked N-acetylglucosamine transferase (SPINDLY family)
VSLLTNVNLAELVAANEDKYVSVAVHLAQDRGRLRQLRQGLRQRMLKSPLMDGPAMARRLEAAYRAMWRQWCHDSAASGDL